MAQGDIFRIATAGPKGLMTISLEFNYDDTVSPDSIDFLLTVDHGGKSARVKAVAQLLDDSVTLVSMLSMSDPMTNCLLGCAAQGLTKPLIECYDKSIKAYLTCLRTKGLSIATDVASCAIACLTSP